MTASPTLLPAYSLEALKGFLPTPTRAMIAAALDDEGRPELVALGAEMESAKILADEARLYSEAYSFWQRATPAQRHVLVGFSLELLAVAVDRALALRDLARTVDARGVDDGAEARSRQASLRACLQSALALRDQARGLLRGVAGHNRGLAALIDGAAGRTDTPEHIAHALCQLAAVAEGILNDANDPIAAKARLRRLDAGYLASLTGAASALRASAKEATRLSPVRAAREEIDYLDGINVHLLAEIVGAFEAAHDRDVSIPKLAPITTRRLFAKRRAPEAFRSPSATSDGATGTPHEIAPGEQLELLPVSHASPAPPARAY